MLLSKYSLKLHFTESIVRETSVPNTNISRSLFTTRNKRATHEYVLVPDLFCFPNIPSEMSFREGEIFIVCIMLIGRPIVGRYIANRENETNFVSPVIHSYPVLC